MPPVDPALLEHIPDGTDRRDWATALAIGKVLRDAGIDVTDVRPTRTQPATYGRTGPVPQRANKTQRRKPKPKRPRTPTRDERLAATLDALTRPDGPDGTRPPRGT